MSTLKLQNMFALGSSLNTHTHTHIYIIAQKHCFIVCVVPWLLLLWDVSFVVVVVGFIVCVGFLCVGFFLRETHLQH